MPYMTLEELKLQRQFYLESIRKLLPSTGIVPAVFRERAKATIENINQQLTVLDELLDVREAA